MESRIAVWRAQRSENTSPRLEAYIARTQNPLDILILLTLWLVMAPQGSLIASGWENLTWTIGRLTVSILLGADLVIRCHLAPKGWRYVCDHPFALLAVGIPPVRLASGIRLIKSFFQRRAIVRFLLAAAALLINGMVLVYLYEKDAPGATIHSFSDAIWWGVVTISTVGYGDEFPVTVGGRVVATGIMAMAMVTLAVITAQISASYVRQTGTTPIPSTGDVDLHHRLDHLETLLSGLAEKIHEPHDRTDSPGETP